MYCTSIKFYFLVNIRKINTTTKPQEKFDRGGGRFDDNACRQAIIYERLRPLVPENDRAPGWTGEGGGDGGWGKYVELMDKCWEGDPGLFL